MKFGTLDYENITYSLNFYYRNYNRIPFDMKISYGEYLAGDIGSTIELSRSFLNGTKLDFLHHLLMLHRNNLERVRLIKGYFLISQYMEILLIIHGVLSQRTLAQN